MAIIVEGFDNSGKSTLARSFDLEVLHPGPRPRNFPEEVTCLNRQLDQARLPVVLDRVTCISTPSYTGKSFDGYRHWLDRMLSTHHCILIYCRPPLEVIKNFSRHVAKGYDEEKQIRWLIEHAEEVVHRYDMLMAVTPHMKYDYTKPDLALCQAAFDAQFTLGAWKQCRNLMTRV